MMNQSETNGMLRMVEAQGQALEAALNDIYRKGTLDPRSDSLLHELRIALIDWNQKLSEVRGWNIPR
jgi:hypothetical protein